MAKKKKIKVSEADIHRVTLKELLDDVKENADSLKPDGKIRISQSSASDLIILSIYEHKGDLMVDVCEKEELAPGV